MLVNGIQNYSTDKTYFGNKFTDELNKHATKIKGDFQAMLKQREGELNADKVEISDEMKQKIGESLNLSLQEGLQKTREKFAKYKRALSGSKKASNFIDELEQKQSDKLFRENYRLKLESGINPERRLTPEEQKELFNNFQPDQS